MMILVRRWRDFLSTL